MNAVECDQNELVKMLPTLCAYLKDGTVGKTLEKYHNNPIPGGFFLSFERRGGWLFGPPNQNTHKISLTCLKQLKLGQSNL